VYGFNGCASDYGGKLGRAEAVRHSFGDIDAISADEPMPCVVDVQDREIAVSDRGALHREAALLGLGEPVGAHSPTLGSQ
jgi:hypothetical protein